MFTKKIRVSEPQKSDISPLIVPLIFCILFLFTGHSNINKESQDVNYSQIFNFTERFTHWAVGDGVLVLENPKLAEDFYPNVSRVVVTKPYKIDKVYPIMSVGDLGKDAVIPTEEQVKDAALNSVCEFITMKDVFFNNEGIVIQNETYYPGDCACHWQQCNNYHANNFKKVWPYSSYKECICVTHEYGWFFAHLIVDFFPRFFVIPEEIRRNSYVFITSGFPAIYEALKIVGVDPNKIVVPPPDVMIHADTLYTVAPITCTKFQGNLLLNMRKILAEKFGLDKKPADQYIIYNRENTDFRVVTNFKDISKAIKLAYPKYPWKNIEIPRTLEMQFKCFNSMRVFIAVHGAAFANTLFMQPRTVCCEVQVDRWVDNYLWISLFANVYHIVSRDTTIMWRQTGSKNALNIDTMVKLAEMALKAIGDI